ncbi:unnamed protein product, partial [Heterotrigona itama]
CYMYCLWEQFGLVDDKRELSLNGMLTFFQRIPAYRAEVQKAINQCKGIAKGDNCEYAYRFNKCYAELSPRVSNPHLISNDHTYTWDSLITTHTRKDIENFFPFEILLSLQL